MEFLLDIAKVKKKFANTMATNKKKVSKVKVKSFRVSDADRSKDYFYHSLGKIDDDIGGWLLDRTTVGGWAYQTYTLDRYLNQNSAYQNNLKLDLNKNLKDDFVFDYNFAYTLVENDTTYSGNVYTSMVSNLNIVLTENANSVKFLFAQNQYFDVFVTFNYHISY